MSWTEERIDKAVTMWMDGASAKAIADALNCGISRSAVLGKLNRMGIKRGGVTKPAPVAARRKQKIVRSEPKPKPAPRRAHNLKPAGPSETEIIKKTSFREAGPITLEQCSHSKCRFPLFDEATDPSPLFCGAETIAGSPYCREHHRITHTKYRGRAVKADDAEVADEAPMRSAA